MEEMEAMKLDKEMLFWAFVTLLLYVIGETILDHIAK